MVNASVPFAVPVRGRRKPTAQKRDACVVKDMVELFWFLSLFHFLFAFLWRITGGGPGQKTLKGEAGWGWEWVWGNAIGIMLVSYVVIYHLHWSYH